MKLQSTTIQTISDTHSSVEMVFSDNVQAEVAATMLRLRATVHHQPNSSLATMQARALLIARSLVTSETQRLGDIGGLGEKELA